MPRPITNRDVEPDERHLIEMSNRVATYGQLCERAGVKRRTFHDLMRDNRGSDANICALVGAAVELLDRKATDLEERYAVVKQKGAEALARLGRAGMPLPRPAGRTPERWNSPGHLEAVYGAPGALPENSVFRTSPEHTPVR